MNINRLKNASLYFLLGLSLSSCENFNFENHEHSFSATYQYDSSYHWQSCDCGENTTKEKHSLTSRTVQQPTDTDPGKEEISCSVCGYLYTKEIGVLPHTHKYSESWESNDRYHWHPSACGHDVVDSKAEHNLGEEVVVTAATETSTGLKTRTCSTCGFVKSMVTPIIEHVHNYSIQKYDSSVHWNECSCGAKETAVDHSITSITLYPSTSNTKGKVKKYCQNCSYSVEIETPILGHEHNYSSTWKTSSYKHWHECECGEKNDEANHEFGSWSITKEASETEEGSKKRTCSVCDYCEVKSIPKIAPPNKYPVENYYDGYYSPIVSWTDGEDLKQQLHTLISKDFVGLVYEGNWETNKMTEQSLTDFNKVNVVYSALDDAKSNTYGASTSGWQREHAFCASLMTAYNTGEAVNIHYDGTSRATDFHNLFAAYGAANGSRGNKNLGCYNPNNETATAATNTDTHSDPKNFEPNDVDKGRMARAIFYMGVMYNEVEESCLGLSYKYKDSNNYTRSTAVTINAKYKPLSIVENYVDYSQVTFTDFVSSTSTEATAARNTYLTKYKTDTTAYSTTTAPSQEFLAPYASAYSDYRYEEGNFAIGNLSTLLEWNDFSVDRQEMWHNETVYSYVHTSEGANKGKAQNNRNPFVDYPELVDYVYGSKKNQAGRLEDIKPTSEDLQMNSFEVNNYALDTYKAKYLVGETITSADFTIKRVNKDFTIETANLSNVITPYTFTDNDIGNKTIVLSTPSGNISYTVKVEASGGINACNYCFNIEKTSFSTTSLTTAGTNALSYGGVSYNVKVGNACSVAKKDTYVQVGNSTTPCQTLTIESVDNFTYDGKSNIESVYLGLNTASSCTYSMTIKVGDTTSNSISFSYNKNGPQFYEFVPTSACSGKLTITISGASKALYISCIAIKVS